VEVGPGEEFSRYASIQGSGHSLDFSVYTHVYIFYVP